MIFNRPKGRFFYVVGLLGEVWTSVAKAFKRCDYGLLKSADMILIVHKLGWD